jgi:hypothetical protein
MRYITNPTVLLLAQGVQKEDTGNIYKVMMPKNKAPTPKKITNEHSYKELGVSTNRGKYSQKPPV